ncbi:MAG TPA: histidine--tRNA ligase [Gemmatimonadetes bacterium]|nr:histidine--tRNA ligase [Gemmatimonadota bacterium]
MLPVSHKEFTKLPGFRDFPPEDFDRRSHIQGAWRRVAQRYGFQEYDGPPLESLDLYVEKSGDEIVGQLYNFVDKGGRDVALRPEMTPSLARILAKRSRGMSKPIKWFSMPQLFRYERAQRGRLREHFQWNVDIIGEPSVAADAEVLAIAIDGLRELGFTAKDFSARVSDRRLLTALLLVIGVQEENLGATFGVIDKIERLPAEKAEHLLVEEAGLDKAEIEVLKSLLSSTEIDDVARAFGDDARVAEELHRFRQYTDMLEAMGLGDFVELDLRIVRGLAYYTGIVFELFDREGDLRAICGGGRYDRLLELVGGDPQPAVGFGMGDVVLGELLKEMNLVPEYERALDYFLVAVTGEEYPAALRLAHQLRDQGHSVAYGLKQQGVVKQMKAAAREGANTVLIIGPDELANGTVLVRDMTSGEQREVQRQEFE